MRVAFRVFSGSERLGDLAQVARQLNVDRVDQFTVRVVPNGTSYAQVISATQFGHNVLAAMIQSRNANVNVRVGQNTLGGTPLQSGGALALVDINAPASTLFYVNNPGSSNAFLDILLVG